MSIDTAELIRIFDRSRSPLPPPEVPARAAEVARDIFSPPKNLFWTPYPKQQLAIELASKCFELLFGGSAGPGKSMMLRGYACDYAASHPGAHVAIVRRTLPQLRQTHGLHLPSMLDGKAKENRSDFTWLFPNGSLIRFISLPNAGDEQDYKSAEFDLLLFDELTEFLESQYTFMLSRVRSARGHRAHVVCTSNPEGVGFRWVKRRFVSPRPEDLAPDQEYPRAGEPWTPPVIEKGQVLTWQPTRCYLPATLADNPGLMKSNPGYIQQLQSLPDSRMRRALVEGDWDAMDAIPGALWGFEVIDKYRVESMPPDVLITRRVIGVDPSGSSNSGERECGIVCAALGNNGHVYILLDASGSMPPDQWAGVVAQVYATHEADRVVAERNYGGQMVEATLRHAESQLPVKLITSSRGKALRAEPVAALTERGVVHLVGRWPELEDQMVSWTPASGWSPDRLDAMVFAVTELLGGASALAYLTEVSAPCPECRTPNSTNRPTCSRCGATLPRIEGLAPPAGYPRLEDEKLNIGPPGTITFGGLIIEGHVVNR
jgi:Terminase large subunit, T4likevirus-type, N-terminal/Terminase RNaseH-like domain